LARLNQLREFHRGGGGGGERSDEPGDKENEPEVDEDIDEIARVRTYIPSLVYKP